MSIPLLGEKVGLHRAAPILVGLAGVIVVVQPGSAELTLGHLAASLAALGAALQSVISRKVGGEERPVVMMLFPLLAIFVTMGSSLAFVYEPMALNDLLGMAGIALLGFVATFCLVAAYRRGEAAIVAPMQYSQIIWATIYGSLLFNEHVTTPVLIGSSLVIASGLYIVAREAFGGQSMNKPVTRTRSRSFAPGGLRVSTLLRGRRG
jgi:drug/metabolite transporter (DMT)-like permease